MKTYLGLAALAAVLAVPAAHADYSGTINIVRNSGYYAGDGGEFTVTPSASLSWVLANYTAGAGQYSPTAFQTFCIERNEYITPPNNVDAKIEPGAVAGGVGGPNPDVISKGTAYLYSLFANGSLTGYDYSPGSARGSDARALQKAIWYLEDEFSESYYSDSGFGSAARDYVDLATSKYGNLAGAKADNYSGGAFTTEYKVMALNLDPLGDPTSPLYQSQLVIVPEASTYFAASLLGLPALVGLIRRRWLTAA